MHKRIFLLLLPAWMLLLAFNMAGFATSWSLFALGALGWLAALALRRPLLLLLNALNVSPATIKYSVLCSSGPIEEGVRVFLLVFSLRSRGAAVSLGCGWAEAEALISVVGSILAAAKLKNRSGPKTAPTRENSATHATTWGLLERSSSALAHVGFSLIAAAHPSAFVVTAVLHSAVNIVAISLITRSILLTQLIVLAFSITVLLAGLLFSLKIA
jgi:hypothetical protein